MSSSILLAFTVAAVLVVSEAQWGSAYGPKYGPAMDWSKGPVTDWTKGPAVGWPNGPAVGWTNGPAVDWSKGPSIGWPNGPAMDWTNGPAMDWSKGPAMGWPTAPASGWSNGPAYGPAVYGPDDDVVYPDKYLANQAIQGGPISQDDDQGGFNVNYGQGDLTNNQRHQASQYGFQHNPNGEIPMSV